MIGSMSRLLHASGPESMSCLIHPSTQAMIPRMITVRVDLEGFTRAILCSEMDTAQGSEFGGTAE